jgi:predicted nucleotidyltransferase component of viral defense system
MEITREVIEDVAADLGINDPSLVEKDFYVVQALSLLNNYESDYFELIFAGGTCLSKIFPSLQRMSEDVDIKVLLTDQGSELGRSALRSKLRSFKEDIKNIFENNGYVVEQIKARNENHLIELELKYVRIFDVIDALRPNIKLELTVCDYACSYDQREISSLINVVMKTTPEIDAFACIDVIHTAAEKFVSLLRRTAALLRGIDQWSDDALIRHLYDLHIINTETQLGSEFIELVNITIAGDGQQFANKHKEFLDTPYEEIESALHALNNDTKYRLHYEKFLGPLVYSQSKPTFDDGLNTLNHLASIVLNRPD